MQEGLEMTCRNDAQCGFGPVQLSQELHSHHPFGKSPEGHTRQLGFRANPLNLLVACDTVCDNHKKPLASGFCMSFTILHVI